MPLQFKPNFKHIQKVYPNGKAKQETEQEHKVDFESDRNAQIEKRPCRTGKVSSMKRKKVFKPETITE